MIEDVDYKKLNEHELREILESLLAEADCLCEEISRSDIPLYEKSKAFYDKVNKIRHYVSLKRNEIGTTDFYNYCFKPTIIDACRGYPREYNKTLIFSSIYSISDYIRLHIKY